MFVTDAKDEVEIRNSKEKQCRKRDSLVFRACGVASDELGLEFAEPSFANCGAGILHELEVKVEIVEGEHALGDDFSSFKAVAEESSRKAGDMGVCAVAERLGVEFEFLIFNVDWAIGGEGLAVARTAGGVDTVEHVDSLSDHFEKLGRGAESHGVAWLVLGGERVRRF